MRLIDGDALLAKAQVLGWDACGQLCDLIRDAPALQPEGDAISRDALLADFERYKANRHPLNNGLTIIDDCIANIKNFPSLPAPAPDVDVVTAEEIVEGITWGPEGPLQRKVHRWFEEGVDLEFFHGTRVGMSHHEVADLLTGAMRRGESVTWPEGHPRNPTKPKPPTLLEELLKAYIELHSAMALATGGIPLTTPLIRKVEAAIEREKGKEGTK